MPAVSAGRIRLTFLLSGRSPLDRALQLQTSLAQKRWRKAVDNLWREIRYYRRARLADRERERADKRLKNLRRIVRKALSEYHRLELERQARG
jgi:hypothetical protein